MFDQVVTASATPAPSATSAAPLSSKTLYQDRPHVRLLLGTSPGMIACSSAKAALRSVPIPLTIPTKTSSKRIGNDGSATSARPPKAASKEKETNDAR